MSFAFVDDVTHHEWPPFYTAVRVEIDARGDRIRPLETRHGHGSGKRMVQAEIRDASFQARLICHGR